MPLAYVQYGRLKAAAMKSKGPFLLAVLFAALAGGVLASPQPNAARSAQTLYGDADCSGSVDSIDALIILQYVAGLVTTVNCPANADANVDGETTALDAALILQYSARLVGHLGPPARAVAVVVGGRHTCALTAGGGAKCWGEGFIGQLGDGASESRNVPVDVVGLQTGIVALAAGGDYTCALTESGGVKCWGDNYIGQLGDGTTTNRSSPVDVVGLQSGVVAIAAGDRGTCALTDASTVKCWGSNEFGQLGSIQSSSQCRRTCGITPVDISGLADVSAITMGSSHICALTSGGVVECWGSGDFGILGNGTSTGPEQCQVNVSCSTVPVDVSDLGSGVSAISAGGIHTCALTAVGAVKCWGDNTDGKLGATTSETCETPYSRPSPCSTAPVDVTDLSAGVAAIDAGLGHTCAITATGALMCWGWNNMGQLGIGTAALFNKTPVQVVGLTTGIAAVASGGQHTCALISTGAIKCWGENLEGQLGDGTTTEPSPAPVDVIGFGG